MKTNVTETEIQALVNFFDEKKAQGSLEGMVPVRELLPLIESSDQTKERIVKLLIPRLEEKGISLISKGLNFEFHIKDEQINQKPVSGKTNPVHIEHNTQDNPWISKPTRLNHSFEINEAWGDIKKAVSLGDIVHLVGPPGCGKSILLEQIALDLNIPFVRFSLGGHIDPANLLGDIQLTDSESGQGIITFYSKGILAEMAERGGMIIFDELDMMDASGNAIFQRIAETDGQIVIKTHDKHRPTVVIQRHPKFRMAFTSNTEGHGDVTGMFAGAHQQNQSLLDRINARFFIGYDTFRDFQIMRDSYKLPAGVIKALFGASSNSKIDSACLVEEIRAKCKADNGWRTHLTSRMLMDVAAHYAAYNGAVATTTFSWHKTMLFYFVNKFPVHYRKLVMDMIRTKLGSEFEPCNDSDKIIALGPKLKNEKFFPEHDTFLLPSMGK